MKPYGIFNIDLINHTNVGPNSSTQNFDSVGPSYSAPNVWTYQDINSGMMTEIMSPTKGNDGMNSVQQLVRSEGNTWVEESIITDIAS